MSKHSLLRFCESGSIVCTTEFERAKHKKKRKNIDVVHFHLFMLAYVDPQWEADIPSQHFQSKVRGVSTLGH